MWNWLQKKSFHNLIAKTIPKLSEEFENNAEVFYLALFLAHACFPKYEYGDKEIGDAVVKIIRASNFKPCHSGLAFTFIDVYCAGRLGVTANELFLKIYGRNTDEALKLIRSTMEYLALRDAIDESINNLCND